MLGLKNLSILNKAAKKKSSNPDLGRPGAGIDDFWLAALLEIEQV